MKKPYTPPYDIYEIKEKADEGIIVYTPLRIIMNIVILLGVALCSTPKEKTIA
jgi:hypothetical protein